MSVRVIILNYTLLLKHCQRVYPQYSLFISSKPFHQNVNQHIVGVLLSAILCLIAAFILFVVGILFIIRVGVLWIIMILAPLAFLFMALPATKKHASKWWDTLFNQSFFAPAFLFLFYLTIQLTQSDFMKKMNTSFTGSGVFGGSEAGGLSAVFTSVLSVVLPFSIVGIFMIASLVVAKQMASAGTGGITAYADKAGKLAQGYAGKMSRMSRRGAGWAAERMLDKGDEEGKDKRGRIARAGGWVADRIPFANRGLAKLSGMREQENKKRQKEREKEFGSYSVAGLKAIQGSRMMTDTKRKAITDILAKKEDEADNKKWYGTNKDRDFDGEIEGYQKEINDIEQKINTSQYVDEKHNFEIEKSIKMEKIKKLKKNQKRMEKMEGKKSLEGAVEGIMKKKEESQSGGSAKPAPASAPKT